MQILTNTVSTFPSLWVKEFVSPSQKMKKYMFTILLVNIINIIIQPLTIITKCSILDVAAVLGPPLIQ